MSGSPQGRSFPLIGLTGGIASGKTTVSRILEGCGAAIIDADLVAREVVQPGEPAYLDIVSDFGAQILGQDGQIDRARLAARIFRDDDARHRLNQYTHPRVRAAMAASLDALRASGDRPKAVVMVIPLLFENGLESMFDETWLVDTPETAQLERLQRRDGLSKADALARIRAQMPLSEKRKRATHTITNADDLESLRAAVQRQWDKSLMHRLWPST